MRINVASADKANKIQSTQRKWVAPTLTRFSAGLAENGFSGAVSDGQFTGS